MKSLVKVRRIVIKRLMTPRDFWAYIARVIK